MGHLWVDVSAASLQSIGVGKAFASPPSEPCGRFSRFLSIALKRRRINPSNLLNVLLWACLKYSYQPRTVVDRAECA